MFAAASSSVKSAVPQLFKLMNGENEVILCWSTAPKKQGLRIESAHHGGFTETIRDHRHRVIGVANPLRHRTSDSAYVS